MTSVRAGFSAEIARRLTQVTYRQLDYWDRTGLVRPSVQKARGKGSRRVYAFEDLVELRVVARLLALGIKLTAVRAAARYLSANFSNVTRPLAQLTLLVDGKRILVRVQDGKALVDASHGGQVLIAVPVGVIAEELGRTVSNLRAPREITFRAAGASYVAVLTPDLEVGGFSVSVPELPGVFTEGDTVAEARRNVVEAASLWLEAQGGRATRRRAAR
jgi:predicted RNase H-like HicB family nuclease/DNA-binding transcriptional MerR regulator